MKRLALVPALGAAAICTAALFGDGVWAAEKKPAAPTIKDLAKRPVEVKADTPVASTPAKAMDNYRRFLELQKSEPAQRAEALRRLGDLSLESGELERMENEVARIDLAGADAIRLYTTLLKAHPDYPRNDQVLYQLARAYETTGQPEQALATLDQIVQRYPASPQMAEVQFRRGEILFSAQRYKDAEAAYATVLRPARAAQAATLSVGAFYQQSLYKHGWSLFKQSLNEESLISFGQLLDLKLIDPANPQQPRALERLSRADREMVEDTLRVMGIGFSYQDGAESLDRFIAQRGPTPYAYLLYSRLGDLYVDKQRFQDGATTYRAFVTRDPNNEFAPGLSMQAIEAYRKGGFAQLVLDGKREYVEHYDFQQPFWQGRDRAQYPTVVAELKTNLKDVAEYYHSTAQKSRRNEDYQQAARWYRSMLASFPDDPESVQTNYHLADALYESHQYADAVTEYERTAYAYPLNAKSADAAYAGLDSWQKQEAVLPAEARAAWHRRSVDAGLKFATTFPEHKDSTGVLTRAAQDLYAARELDLAAKAAEQVLAAQPPADAQKRRIAYTLVGQVAFDQGSFDRSEAAWLEARKLTAAKDAENANLTERLAVSVYRQGEAKNKAGDSAGAVEDFLRVSRVAPDSTIRATAQYDAAAALVTIKDWPRAIDVLEAYRKEYPKTPYAADITRKLAVAYEQGGRPQQAAVELERIAASTGEDPALRREALSRSAAMYEQAGDRSRTVAQLEKFVKDYPRPLSDSMETRQKLADIAASEGNTERVRYWQREIVKADSAAGSERSDRTRYLAAKAQLALAEPARDAFYGVKLAAPLNKSLAAKRKSLEGALQAYKDAAQYNVAEVTTASGYEMAELYRRLAKDLMASERPKRLSADELEQYDLLLEEQAFPFEEQAIKLHEANAARAREGLYDASVKRSYAALAELKPGRFGKTELTSGYVRNLAVAGVPGAGVPPAETEAAPPAAANSSLQAAVTLAEARQYDAAYTQFMQLAQAHPQYAGAALDAGIAARAAGKLEESEQALQTATQRAPSSVAAWNELGITLRERGKFQEALAAYDRALALDGASAASHRNAGVLLDLYLEDPQRALAELERYKELSAEDRAVTGWIADLKQRLGIREPRPEAAAAPAADAAAPAEPAPAPPAAEAR